MRPRLDVDAPAILGLNCSHTEKNENPSNRKAFTMGQIVSAAVHRPKVTSIQRQENAIPDQPGAIVLHTGPKGYDNSLTVFFNDESFAEWIDAMVSFQRSEQDPRAILSEVGAISAIGAVMLATDLDTGRVLDGIARILAMTGRIAHQPEKNDDASDRQCGCGGYGDHDESHEQ